MKPTYRRSDAWFLARQTLTQLLLDQEDKNIMDHLPHPSIHNPHLLLLYLAQRNPEFSYDNLGFRGSPKRKGAKNPSFQLGHSVSDFTEHAAIF